MTPKEHDTKILWALNKADEYLHTAWKHSTASGVVGKLINDSQKLLHQAIRQQDTIVEAWAGDELRK